MHSEVLTRYERSFRRNRWLLFIGLAVEVLVILFVVIRYLESPPHSSPFSLKTHPWIAAYILISLLVSRGFLVGGLNLFKMYEAFLRDSQIREAAMTLHNVTRQPLLRPRFKYFLLAKSLKGFEEEYVSLFKRQLKLTNKIKHWQYVINKANATSEKASELDGQFRRALLLATNEKELNRYIKRYEAVKSFEDARRIIAELEIGTRKQASSETKATEKASRLRENLLAAISKENGLCTEAATLLRSAEIAPYKREEINYLKRAISTQREFNKRKYAPEIPEGSEKPSSRPVLVQNFRSLQEVIAREYDLTKLLPDGMDKEMATQILVALIEPGKRDVHIFAANYKPYDTLKRMVVRRYKTRLRMSFPAKSLDETLKWLLREKILMTKPKTDEPVYSLNPSPSECSSPWAAEIVRRTVSFERDIKA